MIIKKYKYKDKDLWLYFQLSKNVIFIVINFDFEIRDPNYLLCENPSLLDGILQQLDLNFIFY